MIHEVGNIKLCELLETEPKTQCKGMFIILGRRHRLLHVRALLAQRNRDEQEICPVHHGPPFYSSLLYKERAASRAPLREEARRQGIPHRPSAQEEVQKEVLPGYPRSICTR